MRSVAATRAGAALREEADLTVGLITAAATLSLKTGVGCVVGLVAALLCGGYAELYALARRGELGKSLLRGVSQPLLSRYQPAEEPPSTRAEDEEEAAEAPPKNDACERKAGAAEAAV